MIFFWIFGSIFSAGFLAFCIYYFHGLLYRNFGDGNYERNSRWFPFKQILNATGKDNYIFFIKIQSLFGIVISAFFEYIFLGGLINFIINGGSG